MPKKQKTPEYKRDVSCEIIVNSPEPAENCFERLREAYAITKTAYMECCQALKAVQQRQLTLPISELVDCQFALRESAALADDLRKEFTRLQKVMATITCALWSTDPLATEKIEGEYCSAWPALKERASIPEFKKDPIAYHELMDWLGCPRDLQDNGTILADEGEFETEVLKISYPGFQSYYERTQALDYPLPPGIKQNEVWQEAVVTIRKTCDLL